MFTKQFYNILLADPFIYGTSFPTGVSFVNSKGSTFGGLNSAGRITAPFGQFPTGLSNTDNYGFYREGICFGSGTSEPTEDDYCLKNDLRDSIELITNKSTRTITKEEDGTFKVVVNYDYILQNTSTESFTINEYGIYIMHFYDNGRYYRGALAYRALMDEPLTVEANQAFTFQKTLTFKTTNVWKDLVVEV